jgi:DNA-binding transcriptional MerR regulator
MNNEVISYTINDLEQLTGIKAHTIRIWEKRYDLLSPSRTDTNIRVYDDEDLRKILNVSSLINAGWKISKVSSLSSQQLESSVWASAKSEHDIDKVYEIYLQAMISATLGFDEDWFETVYTDVTTRFGLPVVMEHVIAPFLSRIGLMWAVNRLHPGQEHFASNLIRRKILSATDRLPRLRSRGTYMLFLPPWEDHEIGLLYAQYLIRSAGYHVVYLGQRVPVASLVATIETIKPNALLSFFVTEYDPAGISEYMNVISATAPGVTWGIATRSGILGDISLPSGATRLNSSQALIEML